MDIQQIIDGITTSECVNCKFGKALIALKTLRDDPATKEKAAPPAAPKSKFQGKTAKRQSGQITDSAIPAGKKNCNSCNMTKPLDEFPKSASCTGGRTGTCKTCTYERHKRNAAKKAGKQTARSDKTAPSISEPQPKPGIIHCNLCDYRALDKARMASHMRTSHGVISA